MKPFYLTKNQQGYYRAVFYNQQTGLFSSSKSTHCKDKTEAMLIAAEWYKNGSPEGYTNSRKSDSDNSVSTSGLNLNNIVSRLSQSEAVLLVSLISQLSINCTHKHLSYYDLLKIIAKFCDVDLITKEIANFNRNMYLINRKDIADKILKRMGESDINKWEM